MTSPLVIASKDEPGIISLKLHRPEKRNALNIEMMKEFCNLMEQIKHEQSIRVIILHGAGPSFCAGLDLADVANQDVEEESSLLMQKTLLLIRTAPQVTIAAVHGAAIAGGAGIMAAADFVIAASDLVCGFPEVHRGIVAAQVAVILQQEIAYHHLRELLLLGELFHAQRALEIGLVDQVVPGAELLDEALTLAQKILKGAPEAIRLTKRLLQELNPISLEEAFLIALPVHRQARHSVEALEGAKAFLEKRPPLW